jgi:pimeloyl-ACP methyl ester carboxylesterase
MKESYAKSKDNVLIHFLDNEGSDSSLPPLVVVPGMMGLAGFHERELQELLPRRVIAITHRGLGKSQVIEPGQGSFAARTSDIATVVEHLDLEKYFLYGFSRGVSLVVAHSLKSPQRVLGLILHDCEPTYPKISEKWRDMLIAANRPHIPAKTVEAYCKDSELVDLNSRLNELPCPTLILRGEKEGSLLPEAKAKEMKEFLQNSEIMSLPNSAHELADLDHALFVRSLEQFMIEQL